MPPNAMASLMFSTSVGLPPYFDVQPTNSGPSAPPPQPTVFIRPAAVPRARGSMASKSEAKMPES